MACHLDGALHADARPLLVATVPGRESGVAPLRAALNALPGWDVRGAAASAGWMHLARFVRQWTTMRRKMTTPDDPDFAYFSQFLSTPRDGFAPAAEDTDFRSFEELMRRQIKPAWYHFYNLTKVLCEVRSLAMHSLLPPAAVGTSAAVPARFGFVHAFEAAHAGTADPTERDAYGIDDVLQARRRPPHTRAPRVATARPPAPAPDSRARRVSQSLDVFLLLFPRGRVLIHLPASPLPPPRAAAVRVRRRRRRRHEARGGVRRARRRSVARRARPTDARACAVRPAAAPRCAAAHVCDRRQPAAAQRHAPPPPPRLPRNAVRRRAAPGRRPAHREWLGTLGRAAPRSGRRRRARARASTGRRRGVAAVVPAGALQGAAGEGAGLRCVACPATLGEWA